MSKTKAEKESKTLYTKGVPNYIWYKLSPEAKARVCVLTKCTDFKSAITVARVGSNIAVRDDRGIPFSSLYFSDFDKYDEFIKDTNEYYEKLSKKKSPAKKIENKYKIPEDIWKELPDEAKENISDVCNAASKNKLTTNGGTLALRDEYGTIIFEVDLKRKTGLKTFFSKVKTHFKGLKEKKSSPKEEEEKKATKPEENPETKIVNSCKVPEFVWEKLSNETKQNVSDAYGTKLENKLTTDGVSLCLRNKNGSCVADRANYQFFFVKDANDSDKLRRFAANVNEHFEKLLKEKESIKKEMETFSFKKEIPDYVYTRLSDFAKTKLLDLTKLESETENREIFDKIVFVPKTEISFKNKFGETKFPIKFKTSKQEEIDAFISLTNSYFKEVEEKEKPVDIAVVRNKKVQTVALKVQEIEDCISVLDYALNLNSLYVNSNCIEQNCAIGNLKPNKSNSRSGNLYYLGHYLTTKEKVFDHAMKEIQATDPVSKTKFNIPNFIIERLKQNNLPYEEVVLYEDYIKNPSKYESYFRSATNTTCMFGINNGEPAIIFVEPGDYNADVLSGKFWCVESVYKKSSRQRLTHIGFEINHKEKTFREQLIRINGKAYVGSDATVQAIKVLSEQHKKDYEEMKTITETVDENGVLKIFCEVFGNLEQLKINIEFRGNETYLITQEGNKEQSVICFSNFSNKESLLKDLQKIKKRFEDDLTKKEEVKVVKVSEPTIELKTHSAFGGHKISVSDAQNHVSVLDYALNPKTLAVFPRGIEQNTSIGNLLPVKDRNGGDAFYYIENKQVTKQEAFTAATKLITVTDPVTKTKFTVPSFIVERLKQNKISYDEVIDFNTYITNPEKYEKYLQNIKEPICLLGSNVYGPGLVFIYPGDCPSKIDANNPRFWTIGGTYENSKTQKLTHIGFEIEPTKQTIKENEIFINGKKVSQNQALEILSKQHEENYKEIDGLARDINENGIPKIISEMFSGLKSVSMSRKLGESSDYVLSIKGKTDFRYFSFSDFLTKEDLEKELQSLVEFYQYVIDKNEKPKEELKQESKQEEKPKEEIIPQETESVAVAAKLNKIKTIAISDSREVAKRLAVMKISQASQNIFVNLILKNSKAANQNELRKKLEMFFSTENGKAVLQAFTSVILPQIVNHVPEKYRGHLSSMSDEFRIQAESQLVISLLDKVTTMFENNAVNKFLELNQFVRIDSSQFGSVSNIDKEYEIEAEQPLVMSGMSK